MTTNAVAVLEHLAQAAPRIISAVDDVLESGVRSSNVTGPAIELLDETLSLARTVPEVRERLQLLIDTVAMHAHASGPLEIRLAALKAKAQELAGPSALSPHWWVVLGVNPRATLADVEARYRQLVKRRHPDAGGSHDEMIRLTEAMAEATSALVTSGDQAGARNRPQETT
jgi:hypothetical protein